MTASYIKAGINYLPAIIHPDGRRETLHGDPLATIAKARFYARLELAARGQAAFRAKPRNPFDGM
jgi:hypothetical protein